MRIEFEKNEYPPLLITTIAPSRFAYYGIGRYFYIKEYEIVACVTYAHNNPKDGRFLTCLACGAGNFMILDNCEAHPIGVSKYEMIGNRSVIYSSIDRTYQAYELVEISGDGCLLFYESVKK